MGLLLFINFQSCRVVSKNSLGKASSGPTNNDNYIYLEDIKLGKELDRAHNTSDAKYFDYIMSNEVGNPKGKPVYETVLSTTDKVYYGVLRTAPNGKIIVDPFYSAPIDNINIYFPGFEDIDGAHVRAKVFYSFFDKEITMRVKPVCETSYTYNYKDYDIELTDKGIRVDVIFQGKCYENVIFGMELSTVLDPLTLDVIQYYYEIRDTSSGQEIEDGYISDTKNVLKKGIGGNSK